MPRTLRQNIFISSPPLLGKAQLLGARGAGGVSKVDMRRRLDAGAV